MAQIIDNLSTDFIGIVKGYVDNSSSNNEMIDDESELFTSKTPSRALEVYIPKLMPGIDERNQNRRTVLTNCGNPNINVKYNKNIVLGNTIKLFPRDTTEPLPKIGSLVWCFFLDDHWDFRYWFKFNPNGSWEVVDKEKYPKILNINLVNENGVEIETEINNQDRIKLDFSDFKIYKTSKLNQDGTKEVFYHLKQNEKMKDEILTTLSETITKLESRISELEKLLGL